jgi:hypothetical protein
MEGSTAMILAMMVLAGGGATGAVLMTEGVLLGDADAGGVTQVEPLPYDGVGTCFRGADTGPTCGTGGCSDPAEVQETDCACCSS